MTYEYICTACGHQWEAEHPISAPPLRDCPKCGKASAKRQVSGGTGFLLKGGGWYADGYGLKSGGSSEKASSTTKSSETSSAAKETTTSSEPASTSKDTTTTTAKPSAKPTSGASD